jgi:hypothetical protein
VEIQLMKYIIYKNYLEIRSIQAFSIHKKKTK